MFRRPVCDQGEASQNLLIKDGDQVMAFLTREDIKSVKVDSTKSYSCKFGDYKMESWIGKPFGSKAHNSQGNGFIYLLAPTPELWTQVLKHRTQILYVADISLIVQNLELCQGSVVLESGTGSGSLTHSLARAVLPHGQVHTFEFHEGRAADAASEFVAHGLPQTAVSVTCRDIEVSGFPEEFENRADAIFLDLPGPWKVIPSAYKCLRQDGRICTFSPCIEQVTKTVKALALNGFYNVYTVECLLRQYDVQTISLLHDVTMPTPKAVGGKRKAKDAIPSDEVVGESKHVLCKPAMNAKGHTGFLTFARKIVDVEIESEI